MKYLLISFFIGFGLEVSSQTWQNVGTGLDREVYDLVKFDNKLYACGKMGVASWNDSLWTLLPNVNGIWAALSLQEYKDTLYVGGDFAFGGSTSGVFRYDGTNWLQTGGDFDDIYWSGIKDLTTFNNKLIAGGSFSSVGIDSIENIAIWDGFTWDNLGFGLNNVVYDVYEYDSKLFAVGQFTASGSDSSIKTIAYWDGLDWSPLDSNQTINSASRLISFDNSLIIGNVWDTLDGIPMNGIAKWNGTNFISMGTNLLKQVTNFWVFNNELYMSGNIMSLNPHDKEHVVLKWNGFFWEQLGDKFDDNTMVISDYNNELFCAGFFESTNYVAKYSSPVGVETIQSNIFQLYPNPCVGELNIKNISVPSNLKIYNLQGNLVMSSKIAAGTTKLDISGLSRGSYFVFIESNQETSTQKLIVY